MPILTCLAEEFFTSSRSKIHFKRIVAGQKILYLRCVKMINFTNRSYSHDGLTSSGAAHFWAAPLLLLLGFRGGPIHTTRPMLNIIHFGNKPYSTGGEHSSTLGTIWRCVQTCLRMPVGICRSIRGHCSCPRPSKGFLLAAHLLPSWQRTEERPHHTSAGHMV